MRVYALDTGKTAGFAAWDDGDLESPFFCEQGPGWELLDLAFELPTPDVVIVERLSISERTIRTAGEVMEAIEQLGVVRYWASKHGIKMVLSNPSDAMKFATDAKLRRGGMWVPGKEHARDASRHLLTRLVEWGRWPNPAALLADAKVTSS